MKKTVQNLLSLFKRKTFLSKKEKIGFTKSTSEEIRKEVDKIILNRSHEAYLTNQIEKRKRLELDILIEIIEENPNYYSISEMNEIINTIC